MAVTNYYAVNGRLRGEDTSGTRLGYLTDALGSVTATIASDGVVQNTYRYKPYGQQLAKTGVGIDPKYQHAGDSGSRKTGLDYSEQYNKYRHLDTNVGRWATADPLFIALIAQLSFTTASPNTYLYAMANPATYVDVTGMHPCSGNPCKYAKDHGMIRADEQGAVVCCDCMAYVCVYMGSDVDKDVESCAKKHERIHKQMILAAGGCDQPGCYRGLLVAGEDEECEAYRAEANCLKTAIRRRCGKRPPKDTQAFKTWRKCAAQFIVAIQGVCDQREPHCKDAGRKSSLEECNDLDTFFY